MLAFLFFRFPVILLIMLQVDLPQANATVIAGKTSL